VELRLIQGTALEPSTDHSVDLRQARTELTLQLPSLAPLPIQIEARKGRQLGCTWGSLTDAEKEQLQGFLYRRPALWPVRRAPFEPLALLVVLGRLLIGCRPETWFRRSALAQEP
jgi:hypothetical protein